MNLDTLPREIVSRCISFLSTKHLTKIILLENIPDHILEAAANNLNNLWYSKRIRSVEKDQVEGFEGSDGIEPYYETDFDQFLRIHKIFEEIHSNVHFGSIIHGITSLKCTKTSMKSTWFTTAKA